MRCDSDTVWDPAHVPRPSRARPCRATWIALPEGTRAFVDLRPNQCPACDKRCAPPLRDPAADTGARPRSPTEASGIRPDPRPRPDGDDGPARGTLLRSQPATASLDRIAADARERPRSREFGRLRRSLSSASKTLVGRRKCHRIRGRLRCCIACGRARLRSRSDDPARMRNRRTALPRPAIRSLLDGSSGLGGKGYSRTAPWRRLCRSGPGPPCLGTRANCRSTTCPKR